MSAISWRGRRWMMLMLVALSIALMTGLAIGQPVQLLRTEVNPWPSVVASGGTVDSWIPDPIGMLHDDPPYYQPGGPNERGINQLLGPIPWLRPGERQVLPTGAPRPRDLATDPLVARWLWTQPGAYAPDPRYPALLDIWAGDGPGSAIEHGLSLAANRPSWAKHWPTWRTRGWLPWGDGDGVAHYDAPMWWLQAACAGSDAAWDAYLEQVAHVLSVGFDWRSGRLRYEKGTHFTGDFYEIARTPWSHRWPAAILAAAHLSGWDPDDAAVQAVPLLARSMVEDAPAPDPMWGVRTVGHYLRSLRAMHLFARSALPDADRMARRNIEAILAAAEVVDGKPAYWLNRGARPPIIEAWQDWLTLSEIAEWAVVFGDRELLERIAPMVRWHLRHTTDTRDPSQIQVGYKLEMPGPWPMETRAATAIHTTYAIPVLTALAHLHPEEFGSWQARAWEAPMRRMEDVGFLAVPPALGSAGGPKQVRRVMVGLRPAFDPRRFAR